MAPRAKSPGRVVSPPLVPDAPALDLDHLARTTLGEVEVEREVLTLFAHQSAELLGRLEGLPPEGALLAHTLKGSACGIGAFAVAEAADRLEQRLRHGLSVTAEVAMLQQALDAALEAVAERLNPR